MIKVILNADDYGNSSLYNDAILDLLEKRLIRSTTVMINRIPNEQKNQTERLIALAKDNGISVGLHIERPDSSDYRTDIEKQWKKFKNVFKKKPSHLDIHKYIDDKKLVNEVSNMANANKIPVRNMGQDTSAHTTDEKCFSTLYLKNNKILEYIETLQDNKTYEILFHPGHYDPESTSSYNKERETDYKNVIKVAGYLDKKGYLNISYNDL